MSKLALFGGDPVSERRIPLARPVFSEKTIRDVAEVLRSGDLRQGERTRLFEERFRQRVGARHAYAVSSGTAALHAAFLSILRPGDEVILPAFTFFATASTVILAGGRPVFADIQPETFLVDPDDVEAKVTPRTRALAPVHLFGNAADVGALGEIAEAHGLAVVSDAAQAHGTGFEGRDVGSFDTLNCYSFYPTKSMTTGEGGMVTTNDGELHRLGLLIRSHGEEERYRHVRIGLNYRMTEIAAAIGLNELEELERRLERRRHLGRAMREEIGEVEGVMPQRVSEGADHSYSYFSVALEEGAFRCGRDEFVRALGAENIECAVHYPAPLTRQPAITALMEPERCPVAEDISRRIFSLPMHPELSDLDVERIIAGVDKVASYYRR